MEGEGDVLGGIVWRRGASLGRVIRLGMRGGEAKGCQGRWESGGDIDRARLGSQPESVETGYYVPWYGES